MKEKMQDYMITAYCWLKNQKGQGMVEYGLILALVAIVAAATLTTMGTTIKGAFTSISTSITTAL